LKKKDIDVTGNEIIEKYYPNIRKGIGDRKLEII